MSRVLVTGGAGFIGHHLVRMLRNASHEVLVLDNLSYGRRAYLEGSGAELVEVDLATVERSRLLEHLESWQPSVVFHLAGIHFIPQCVAHPDQTFASNVRGTFLIAETARLTGVKRLVFASTMDVYSTDDRVHAESHPTRPANIYGLSKALGETAVAYAARTHTDLTNVIFRFANIYGPEETNPHLIPDLLDRLRDQTAPELRMGDLQPTRDFLHVRDLCALLMEAMTMPTEGGVFNAGTGLSVSVRSVVDSLRDIAGDRRPVVEDVGKRRSFVRQSLAPNMEKTFRTFRWRPTVSLTDGLAELFELEGR